MMSLKMGDYVKITKPLPTYQSLLKYKNAVGKVVNVYAGMIDVQFEIEDTIEIRIFFKNEVTKIKPEEYLVEAI